MGGYDDIIKDSSIWTDNTSREVVNQQDGLTRLGIVKNTYNDGKTGELVYLVEVQRGGRKIPMNCRMMRRFGGVYNYEDFTYHGYTTTDSPDPTENYEAKAGDAVLVTQLNGNGREGVILGGITHAARKTSILAVDGPQYKSEFNGLEKYINKDGEYVVTFKGLPSNILRLNDAPSDQIAPPQYNTAVGGSYYKFDKTGGWTISDNNSQLIHIDKSGGTLEINSGGISLKMTKASEAVSLISKEFTITAATKVSVTTKEFLIDSTTRAAIKSSKIAIGKDGVELLDQIYQMLEALGKVQVMSPIGLCSPIISGTGWAAVKAIQDKIKEITGSF